MTCNHQVSHPSLTEEIIQNYDALPPSLNSWKRFRIEYGFECSCPEGLIYLPPWTTFEDQNKIEDILNEPNPKVRDEFWDQE